ncbi:MAG: adenylate/guanylate cyclase domain-containing protein, partial [Verrucomicrobiales bacterium]|nr:adenylate/guanylate cyclase domain-containing protein [Verrucomicrobiales bacterium]
MSRPNSPSGSGEASASGVPGRREVMTMLFTDLVGSTRLKEELGNTEAVRLILEHHGLVRGLLKEYPDGFEISTAGDSFFLAFRRPSDAVAFALRLQGRVERWNRGLKAKLLDRVGIHTGEVTV